jgi:hypothetical protein
MQTGYGPYYDGQGILWFSLAALMVTVWMSLTVFEDAASYGAAFDPSLMVAAMELYLPTVTRRLSKYPWVAGETI